MQEADWQAMYKISYNTLIDTLNNLTTFASKQTELVQVIQQTEAMLLSKNDDSITAIQNFQDMLNQSISELTEEIHQNNRTYIAQFKQLTELANLNLTSIVALTALIKAATLQTEALFIDPKAEPQIPKGKNILYLKKPPE